MGKRVGLFCAARYNRQVFALKMDKLSSWSKMAMEAEQKSKNGEA